MDAAISGLRGRAQAFDWRAVGTRGAVLMRGERVLLMKSGDAAGRAAQALNRLYVDLAPPPLVLDQGPAGV
ncbi:MAG: hypothetical protein ACP5U2_12595 [Bryobacteraceae bacterium]